MRTPPEDGATGGDRPESPGAARAAQRVVEDLFGAPSTRGFGVRYWDGTAEMPLDPPPFTLSIRRPGALRRMLLPPSELSIVEAYLFGDIDIEGDIEAGNARRHCGASYFLGGRSRSSRAPRVRARQRRASCRDAKCPRRAPAVPIRPNTLARSR